ncbi:hypothetical protein E2C01_022344 [Portunus trituberculatus]|uniref:Secreted protein n=1 Tax=Portunus trituberculatus TaxID=210409 RepID=A0A5B7E8N7_PORTR|nr:hypothetical protein [Portunus trituberculatus]
MAVNVLVPLLIPLGEQLTNASPHKFPRAPKGSATRPTLTTTPVPPFCSHLTGPPPLLPLLALSFRSCGAFRFLSHRTIFSWKLKPPLYK